jgi:hypothetical protein
MFINYYIDLWLSIYWIIVNGFLPDPNKINIIYILSADSGHTNLGSLILL